MRETKSLFRRVYDAVVDGRTGEAQREIAQYLKTHPLREERLD